MLPSASRAPGELILRIITPTGCHTISVDADEPLQASVVNSVLSQPLGLSGDHFVLSFDGRFLDYDQSPKELGLEDGDQLDLVPWPKWHWRAHAPSAVLPGGPDILSPLLDTLGGWEGAAKLARLNHSWLALVNAWRSDESRVELSNADASCLRVVAARCRQLRQLTVAGESVLDEAILAVASACPHLQHVNLSGCNSKELSAEAICSIAQHCPRLKELHTPERPALEAEEAEAVGAHELRALQALGVGCPELRQLVMTNCNAPTDGLLTLVRGCQRLEGDDPPPPPRSPSIGHHLIHLHRHKPTPPPTHTSTRLAPPHALVHAANRAPDFLRSHTDISIPPAPSRCQPHLQP